MQRFVHSKMRKTLAIVKSGTVAPHIPETRRMQRDSLRMMLEKYGMVYVKPDHGTWGNGVMRVEHSEDGYQYQTGTIVRKFGAYDELFDSLKRETRNRSYVVQKGIHLLKYKGRRFDIRVMVQKTPDRRWEATGIIGRVAHPRKIVTNFHNGGTLKAVPALMSTYMGQSARHRFAVGLKRLGLSVAKTLEARYPGIKEVGLDVAVDSNMKTWILEVNTCPDPYIFKALKDKRVFRKIFRYAIVYGRIKPRRK